MERFRVAVLGWCLLALPLALAAQVIEFESNGLKYQTLTRGGVTVMYAHLPTDLKNYAVLQVAVANGSAIHWTVKPEDFRFYRSDGTVVAGENATKVVNRMLDRASRNDVIRLLTTYEANIYGISRIQSTNGYEQRRQDALAFTSSPRLKAAAAASAIVFVPVKLKPGESTDGAVFLAGSSRLPAGKLVVRVAGEVFEFLDDDPGSRTP
ncbi:MAG: hypothetical protein MUC42_05685 [Bryobacter sp.]|jgi:hypothetical protein|nr:hypothetical protein [Bryobacter sp.]